MVKSVLLFGATGYIGAAFLSRFNDEYLVGANPQYKLTASTRSLEKAGKLKDLLPHIETTDITLDGGIKLEHEVENYDVVIQLADCDAFEGTKSILKGMKTRKSKTRSPPVLYHASGGAFMFSEEEDGYLTGTIISDLASDLINSIPISKPHRNVDDSIVKADSNGDIQSFIVVPFGVFGTGTGLVHEHKLGNQTSMPIPRLVRVSVERKSVGQIGPGENPWMVSQVDDVADLFMALFKDTTKGHGKDGFYFADGGWVRAGEVYRTMAETLHSIAISKDPSPTIYTEEELDKYKIGFWAASIRTKGDRAKSTGWKPQHGAEEFDAYVATETRRLAFEPLDSYGRLLDYSN